MEIQRVLEARRAAGTRAHHPVDGGRMRGFMSVAIWLSVLVIATGARALCGAITHPPTLTWRHWSFWRRWGPTASVKVGPSAKGGRSGLTPWG